MLIVPKETIIGTLNILREKLEHIVAKHLIGCDFNMLKDDFIKLIYIIHVIIPI